MLHRILFIAIFVTAGLTAAPAEKKQTIDFTPGGLIRVKNSVGVLTIEAWDQPSVELTTTKSMDQVSITAERKGNELEIATTLPKHDGKKANITYHLWVPRDSRLAIEHGNGEINIEGVTANITATLRHGDIFLYLPEGGRYITKAECKMGTINSDFTGPELLTHFHARLGHRINQEAAANAHALDLKVGFGDVVIVKQASPKPAPAATKVSAE